MYKQDLTYFWGKLSGIDSIFSFNNNDKSRKKYLEKNNINTDVELFNFIEQINKEKVSTFTPIYKIRQLASLKFFTGTVFPSIDELVILDGKYDGYVFIINGKYKEIHISYNGKDYTVGLFGEYFTDEIYKDIISTIVIE